MTPYFSQGDAITRPANTERARTKLAAMIRWAEQQGFHNIAAELQAVLALLPDEPGKPEPRRRS